MFRLLTAIFGMMQAIWTLIPVATALLGGGRPTSDGEFFCRIDFAVCTPSAAAEYIHSQGLYGTGHVHATGPRQLESVTTKEVALDTGHHGLWPRDCKRKQQQVPRRRRCVYVVFQCETCRENNKDAGSSKHWK